MNVPLEPSWVTSRKTSRLKIFQIAWSRVFFVDKSTMTHGGLIQYFDEFPTETFCQKHFVIGGEAKYNLSGHLTSFPRKGSILVNSLNVHKDDSDCNNLLLLLTSSMERYLGKFQFYWDKFFVKKRLKSLFVIFQPVKNLC